VIGRRGARLDELEGLYRSRFDIFTRVAASVTGDSERARDAVQEGFATALRKRHSFRGEGPLEAWVWRIVLNAARMDVRRSIPAIGDDEPAANGYPERDAELRVALARRPVRQRTAVFLGYYARTEPRASRRAGEPAQRERNYRERLTKVCLARRLGTGRSVRDASTIGLAAVEDEPSGPWCSGSPLGILGS